MPRLPAYRRLMTSAPTRFASTTSPARLALGFAVLVAERVRPGAPTRDAVATTVGVVGRSADLAGRAARRVTARPVGLARRSLRWAAGLPGASLVTDPLAQARDRLADAGAAARDRGRATLDSSRARAAAFVQSTMDEEIMPYVTSTVVPRVIDGALPDIRARVLPVVIEDLTNDPRIRELVVEQSRGVLDEAADQLRSGTATADDRLETAFRRLVGRGAAPTEGG